MDYEDRLNRALDFIETHLQEALSVPDIARVACLSPFHFHRIFRAHTGETLHSTVTRLRVERIASSLLLRPEASLTDLSLEVVFNDSATMSRAFKRHFGVAPNRWRYNSKNHHARWHVNGYHTLNQAVDRPEEKEGPELQIVSEEMIEQDPFALAYLRHTGGYSGSEKVFGARV